MVQGIFLCSRKFPCVREPAEHSLSWYIYTRTARVLDFVRQQYQVLIVHQVYNLTHRFHQMARKRYNRPQSLLITLKKIREFSPGSPELSLRARAREYAYCI